VTRWSNFNGSTSSTTERRDSVMHQMLRSKKGICFEVKKEVPKVSKSLALSNYL
jgi:hypothetical protein